MIACNIKLISCWKSVSEGGDTPWFCIQVGVLLSFSTPWRVGSLVHHTSQERANSSLAQNSGASWWSETPRPHTFLNWRSIPTLGMNHFSNLRAAPYQIKEQVWVCWKCCFWKQRPMWGFAMRLWGVSSKKTRMWNGPAERPGGGWLWATVCFKFISTCSTLVQILSAVGITASVPEPGTLSLEAYSCCTTWLHGGWPGQWSSYWFEWG